MGKHMEGGCDAPTRKYVSIGKSIYKFKLKYFFLKDPCKNCITKAMCIATNRDNCDLKIEYVEKMEAVRVFNNSLPSRILFMIGTGIVLAITIISIIQKGT